MSTNEFGIELHSRIPAKDFLPPTWKQELIDAVRDSAKLVILHLDNPTSREDDFKGREFPTIVAAGSELCTRTPWLKEVYEGPLLLAVESALGERVLPLEDMDIAITGNVLTRNMRFESHTDYWPAGANLYVRWPFLQFGGGLKVSADKNARTYNEIMAAPGVWAYPEEGTISIIKGQEHPHTVEAVRKPLREWQSVENPGFLEWVLNEDVFNVHSWGSDFDTEWSRISLNFNFDTPEQATTRMRSRGVADYVHGKAV